MSRMGELSSEDRRIWGRVTGTVTPRARRKALLDGPDIPAPVPAAPGKKPTVRPVTTNPVAPVVPATPVTRGRGLAEELEPRRQRRLARERDPIDARIDLHGYGRFQAQDALTAFLLGAHARGYKTVLVITGQGRRGGTGVIRGSVHEWLAGPELRLIVSGYAPAARRHGGDGALYVTLRRG